METPVHNPSGNAPLSYEALLAENEELRAQNHLLRSNSALLGEKVTLLEHELAQIKRLLFGAKSERFLPEGTREQLPLFESISPVEAPKREAVTYTRERKKPVRQALPSHLPREVIVIEPEGVDTRALKKIGEEVTETLDYRPAKLIVIRRVRPKYVDPKDDAQGVIIAPLPARPVEKGIAEPSLLAHILVEKYVDHLPLYRQLQRFTRSGITLADSTLADWVRASAEVLVPLHDALRREVLSGGYIQADETPIPVQDQEKAGATHRGYYWVYHAPLSGLVVLDYQKGRGRDGPTHFLAGFEGALQSDGYTAYDAFDQRPGVTTYGCWAHARRYFHESLGSRPDEAAHVIEEIGKLYQAERLLRERGAAPEERRHVRREEAAPVHQELKVYLEKNPGLPRSPWGKAVSYTLMRWEKLTRYVEDGRIEIDNNLVENAIRPIALGRKNYLFAGSHEAAQRAAVVYSLLATCKRHAVNPETWLTDVLGRIPTHPMKRVEELLPHRWAAVKR